VSEAAAAALVIARAPRPGRCKARLEPLLGPEGCARLQAGLVRRAATWALEIAPSHAFVAFDPVDAEAEMRALVPDGMHLVPQAEGDLGDRLAAATGHVFAQHAGPLLTIGVDVPRLHAGHAAAALSDLRDGCDVTLGPALDGGYYLIGLREPRPDLFALPTAAWGGPDVWTLTLAAAREADLSLGLLRAERDLDTPSDARALLADPALPDDVAALLRPA
jgi:rSAM/selenodomain-associated transferase 1